MNTPIYVSSEDYPKLRWLASSLARGNSRGAPSRLLHELDRAVVLDGRALPNRIVRIGSRVDIQDKDSGEIDTYTLCMPERASAENGQLSVLAPVGTALLGYGEGDEIDWETPGGVRHLRILRVGQPALV